MKSKELKKRLLAGASACIPVGTDANKDGWDYIKLDTADLLDEIELHPNAEWDVEPLDPEYPLHWIVWFNSVKHED